MTWLGGELAGAARGDLIQIEPEQATLIGRRATRQLLAAGSVGASARDLTRSVAWVSLDPAVAVVSPTGQVTPRGDGTATIVARGESGSKRGRSSRWPG